MIGILDYGLGNVGAFENIYRSYNIEAMPIRTPDEMDRVDHLVLPGVGAFDWAMKRLTDSGMLDRLNQRVLVDKIPILGVCVGMQMMASGSEEGDAPGLGWIPGEVKKFSKAHSSADTPLPHMGWNTVKPRDSELFRDIEFPQFYFLHSYVFRAKNEEQVIAHCSYGTEFAASIRLDNIWATQFHPEKSHNWGGGILRNFADLT